MKAILLYYCIPLLVAVILLFVIVSGVFAEDGLHWRQVVHVREGSGEAELEQEMAVDNNGLFADLGNGIALIVSLSANTIYLIDHNENSYTEFAMDELAEQMEQARQQAESLMVNMPEDMRENMEGIDELRALTELPDTSIFRPTGDSLVVAGYTAYGYEQVQPDDIRKIVWCSPAIDVEPLRTLYGKMGHNPFVSDLLPNIGVLEYGFTLKTTEISSAHEYQSEVTWLEEKELPSSQFMPPEGYEQAMEPTIPFMYDW